MNVANLSGKMGYLIVIMLAALVLAALFLPQVRQLWLNVRAERVEISRNSQAAPGNGSETVSLNIVTVLGKDGIPAILNPELIPAEQATAQMEPEERVLGVSIDGDHRAYPLNLLSRHEIVNDTVGGVPVSVTW